jgi:hypothetical protein
MRLFLNLNPIKLVVLTAEPLASAASRLLVAFAHLNYRTILTILK